MEKTDREILLEVYAAVQGILEEAKKTNGRIGSLEGWRHVQELAAAKAEGVAIASSGVILTARQLTFLAGIVGAVGTIAGFVARYVGT